MKSLGVDKPLDGNIKPVKDSDGTMSAIELSTGKVRVKGLEVTGTTLLAGGTFAGDIDMSDNDIGNVDAINTVKLSIGTSGLVKNIRDEDDMSHDDASALVTQQSVKAYVDNNTATQTHYQKTVINQAGCNALRSTPLEIVTNQGSGKIALLDKCYIQVDRAATQTNSACDLFISYDGVTVINETILYARRWLANVTTDSFREVLPYFIPQLGDTLTYGDNQKIKITVDSDMTTNCCTSMTVHAYYRILSI